MSHKATNWAVEACKGKGLKPGAKLVLWQLGDRHHPDNGCFPSQKRLAADCEMSRSAVQENIARLEEAGLIICVPGGVDEATKRHKPTRYLLAFEEAFAAYQAGGSDAETAGKTPSSRDRNPGPEAVTGIRPEPGPESGPFRDRNPVRNPVKEPVKEPSAASGGDPDGPPAAASKGRDNADDGAGGEAAGLAGKGGGFERRRSAEPMRDAAIQGLLVNILAGRPPNWLDLRTLDLGDAPSRAVLIGWALTPDVRWHPSGRAVARLVQWAIDIVEGEPRRAPIIPVRHLIEAVRNDESVNENVRRLWSDFLNTAQPDQFDEAAAMAADAFDAA